MQQTRVDKKSEKTAILKQQNSSISSQHYTCAHTKHETYILAYGFGHTTPQNGYITEMGTLNIYIGKEH
jgi:hypothetical protein